MKVLATGGAGFIGSFFVRMAVKEGVDIAVADCLTYAGDLKRIKDMEGRIRFHKADIADKEGIKEVFDKEKPDTIVHFAAESHVDRSILSPDAFIMTNVIGTFNLLSLSLHSGVKRFIHISTDEVYGELPPEENAKFTEESSVLPNSPYSASKASADAMARAFHRTYGLPVVTVRPSNNYGPWQYPEKLIPLAVANAMLGEKIPVYGKGENIRTWLFVENCAEAVFLAMEKGKPGEVYNVGSDEERMNIDIVKAVIGILGLKEDLIEFVPDRPGHDFRYALSSEKIKRQLGWQAKIKLEEGLEKTVGWCKDNRDWLFRKKKDAEGFLKKLKETYAEKGR